MAIIAEFRVLPITAFSNPPAGGNDPFVLSSDDPTQLLGVSIDDDDALIDGDTVVNETADDPNQIATVRDFDGNIVSVDAIYVEWTATYVGDNGQIIEVMRFELDNGLRMFAVSEMPAVGVTYNTSNKNQGADDIDPGNVPQLPCLVRGTRIATPQGARPVETLKAGDLVCLYNGGTAAIRWVGSRKVGRWSLLAFPTLRPVRIERGALGPGIPSADLRVSRQHRMLVQSKIAARMFGVSKVLVPSIRLVTLPGVAVEKSIEDMEYFHILFDRHEIILAEGAPTESLLTGSEALKSLSRETLEEIHAIFPGFGNSAKEPSHLVPAGRLQRKLVWRHAKNKQPVLAGPEKGQKVLVR